MKKRHLYLYFKYLVENEKKLSNLTYLEIRFIFNLISTLDNNYCSQNMLYGSNDVYSLAYRCNIHQIKVMQLLKEIKDKNFRNIVVNIEFVRDLSNDFCCHF